MSQSRNVWLRWQYAVKDTFDISKKQHTNKIKHYKILQKFPTQTTHLVIPGPNVAITLAALPRWIIGLKNN